MVLNKFDFHNNVFIEQWELFQQAVTRLQVAI